ncbi:hypothetical protein [Yoonia sp. 208BN28-4]|uniref:hypothetical protein n=1 Tax=Yoonia sp. 208BN28-4 TaxID=3126505 RepID=UPI003096E935
MRYFAFGTFALFAMTACGGTTIDDTSFLDDIKPGDVIPLADGQAQVANGVYSVMQNGETVILPENGEISLNGQLAWVSTNQTRAVTFAEGTALLIGGMEPNGTTFSGISGPLSAAPTVDDLVPAVDFTPTSLRFDGRVSYVTANEVNDTMGIFFYNPRSERLSGDLTRSGLDGSIETTIKLDAGLTSSGALSGTISINGDDAQLKGGFYGEDSVAGAFNGENIGGVFSGTQ